MDTPSSPYGEFSFSDLTKKTYTVEDNQMNIPNKLTNDIPNKLTNDIHHDTTDIQ